MTGIGSPYILSTAVESLLYKKTSFLGVCAIRRCPFQRKAQGGKLLLKGPRTKAFGPGAARCPRVGGHWGRAEGPERKTGKAVPVPERKAGSASRNKGRLFPRVFFPEQRLLRGLARQVREVRTCRFRRRAERGAASCSFAFSPKWERGGKTPFTGKILLWRIIRRKVSFLMRWHPRKASRV